MNVQKKEKNVQKKKKNMQKNEKNVQKKEKKKMWKKKKKDSLIEGEPPPLLTKYPLIPSGLTFLSCA